MKFKDFKARINALPASLDEAEVILTVDDEMSDFNHVNYVIDEYSIVSGAGISCDMELLDSYAIQNRIIGT